MVCNNIFLHLPLLSKHIITSMKRKGKDFIIKNRKYESCLILFDAGFKPLYCSQAMESYADYIKVEGNVYYGITKDQILPGDRVVSVEEFLKEWNERKGK